MHLYKTGDPTSPSNETCLFLGLFFSAFEEVEGVLSWGSPAFVSKNKERLPVSSGEDWCGYLTIQGLLSHFENPSIFGVIFTL